MGTLWTRHSDVEETKPLWRPLCKPVRGHTHTVGSCLSTFFFVSAGTKIENAPPSFPFLTSSSSRLAHARTFLTVCQVRPCLTELMQSDPDDDVKFFSAQALESIR